VVAATVGGSIGESALHGQGLRLYETLQVSPRASQDVIRAAYRVLARAYHPDTSAEPDAAERMQALNAAYQVLSDPERRAQYDTQQARSARARRGRRTERPARGARPPTRSARQVVYQQASRPIVRLVVAASLITPVLIALALFVWLLLTELDDRPTGPYPPSPEAPPFSVRLP
jgi:DnaJ-domain-containing protein 1